LCGRRRQAIIDSLLPPTPVPQTGGHHPQHVNPNTRQNLNIFRRDTREDDSVDISTLELPQISVTIEMMGHTFNHTMDRNDQDVIPMINVHGISLNDTAEEQVNISDFSIRIL
jgi:hypothetical protein